MTVNDSYVLWTDFGGVLTGPPDEALEAFAHAIGVNEQALKNALREVGRQYGTADPMAPIDTQEVSEAAWISKLSEALSHPVPADALGGRWFWQRQPNRQWIDSLHRLRNHGVRIGLLTNMTPSWAAAWPKMVDTETFEFVLTSSSARARKPSAAIFRKAEAMSLAAPERCVLVDDLEGNCQGARAVGWQAVRFENASQAEQRVLELTGKR